MPINPETVNEAAKSLAEFRAEVDEDTLTPEGRLVKGVFMAGTHESAGLVMEGDVDVQLASQFVASHFDEIGDISVHQLAGLARSAFMLGIYADRHSEDRRRMRTHKIASKKVEE